MTILDYKGMEITSIIKSLPAGQYRHMLHVGELVGILSAKIEYPCQRPAEKDGFSLFGEAASYHDIGKVSVPHHILLKPGKLTDNEFGIVKNHTLFAEELFIQMDKGSILGMPDYIMHLARDSAVFHHEWWNGKGYPYGRSREQIPLIARITSICDAYDAITTDRAYREAHSHEYACREIMRNAGSQFDPALVEVFIKYADALVTFKAYE